MRTDIHVTGRDIDREGIIYAEDTLDKLWFEFGRGYSEVVKTLIESTRLKPVVEVSLGFYPPPFETFTEGSVMFYNMGNWTSTIIEDPTWFDAYFQANKSILESGDHHIYLEDIYEMKSRFVHTLPGFDDYLLKQYTFVFGS